MRKAVTVLAVLLMGGATGTSEAAEVRGTTPELIVQYDFYEVERGIVQDGSGNGHAGTIAAGSVVAGRRKPAVEFTGGGSLSSSLKGVDLARRAFTVGAMCRPAATDGVVVSMGDAADGFSLYVEEGIPHFVVRSGGVRREVADREPLAPGQWVHLAGVVDADGDLVLLVNAFPVATSAAAARLERTPAGAFVVGADPGGAASGQGDARPWRGLIEDVRLYSGAVGRETHRELLGDWANRPGCGCGGSK